MSRVVELTSHIEHDNFIENNKKCVIFFGSKNCGHCSSMVPFTEDLALKNPNIKFGHIEITKVNTENINGVPVFVIYENKLPVEVVLGANKKKLTEAIKPKY
jgi:hypothetical protein